MKVIILSAGIGSRLRPLTDHLPKCLVKINGKEILRYQVESFIENGISEIVLVTGYRGHMIKDFCRDGGFTQVKIIENTDYDTTNNMYSLNLAKDEVYEKDFLFCNGDVMYSGEIVRQMIACGGADAIGVQVGNYNDEAMKVVMDEIGTLNDISKKIDSNLALGTSIDLYKISAEGSVKLFATIEELLKANQNNWTEVALQQLMHNRQIAFYPVDIKGNKWYEIDNLDDYFNAVKMFAPFDIFKKKKAFFDLDGTVYMGNNVLKGAVEFFKQLRENNVQYYFLSNNSSKVKTEYVERINNMGIFCEVENIILPTDALLQQLHDEQIVEIHLVGNAKLAAFLHSNGINTASDNPKYVIVAFDTEVTYDKLQKAAIFIQQGVPYMATNIDLVCPTDSGYIPDTGALYQVLQTTTGIAPKKVFGKPLPSMIEQYISDVDINDVVIMGDRTYTDMQLARTINCDFILTLTGETNVNDLINLDYNKCLVVRSIGDLVGNN